MDLSLLDPLGGTQTVVAIALVLVVVVLLRKLFSGAPTPAYAVTGTCAACHWTGSLSKYRAICPRCGSKVTL